MLKIAKRARATYLAALAFSAIFIPIGIYLEATYTTGFRIALLAIVFSSWYGGLGPGLLSSVIVMGATLALFPVPELSQMLSPDGIYVLTFTLISILISVLNGSLYSANQSARRHVEQRERFLAVISHEIRTPLNGVIGMTGLLARTPLTPLQKEYMSTLVSSSKTLWELVDNSLNFSKLRSRTVELGHRKFSILQEIQECLGEAEARHRNDAVEIVSWFSPSLPDWVSGDPLRFKQIVSNLLGNALKFAERGVVSISVGTRPLADNRCQIRLEVSDTGPGISREDQERIFDVFTQLDDPAQRHKEGAGLGLAICKELVGLMGGTISVKSRLNEGSTFSVVLPFPITSAPEEMGARVERWTVDPKLRILALDDNANNLKVLSAMLEHLGVGCVTTTDPVVALRWQEESPFDLIYLDFYMPLMAGDRVLEALRARHADSKVFILSADSAPERKQAVLRQGADGYLVKPVTLAQLAQNLVDAGVAHGDWAGAPLPFEATRPLLYDYLEELPERIAQIQTCAQTPKSPELQQALHALKSASLMVGVGKIAGLCEDLEKGRPIAPTLDSLCLEALRTAARLGRALPIPQA